MKHWNILLSTLLFVSSSMALAQDYDDDMYFIPKKAKKAQNEEKARKVTTTHTVEVVYEDEPSEDYTPVLPVAYTEGNYSERDVDEYNRRGRGTTSSVDTVCTEGELVTTKSGSGSTTYSLSAQSLYDLGYSEGYSEGYDDADDMDYYYGLRLARFHGRHFYDPWYWGNISYVYHDPWYWNSWYYDPWYRPYYYGGWCSVGWGIGHGGSFWNPYWHGWHAWHKPPHHHPSHWGGHHGPRYSSVRNRVYGTPGFGNRGAYSRDYGRDNGRGNRPGAIGGSEGGRTNRSSLIHQRLNERDNRFSRVGNRGSDNGNRVGNRTNNRSSRVGNRNTFRSENRGTTVRSSERSSSRSNGSSSSSSFRRRGSSSSSSSSSSFRSSSSGGRSGGGGGGIRSSAGGRGGRGR